MGLNFFSLRGSCHIDKHVPLAFIADLRIYFICANIFVANVSLVFFSLSAVLFDATNH
jgi:hypothetical protein